MSMQARIAAVETSLAAQQRLLDSSNARLDALMPNVDAAAERIVARQAETLRLWEAREKAAAELADLARQVHDQPRLHRTDG